MTRHLVDIKPYSMARTGLRLQYARQNLLWQIKQSFDADYLSHMLHLISFCAVCLQNIYSLTKSRSKYVISLPSLRCFFFSLFFVSKDNLLDFHLAFLGVIGDNPDHTVRNRKLIYSRGMYIHLEEGREGEAVLSKPLLHSF